MELLPELWRRHEGRSGTGMNEDNEVFIMTPWGCLSGVLTDYGVDISHITPRMGVHMVEDFMDAMVKAGHVAKEEGAEKE